MKRIRIIKGKYYLVWKWYGPFNRDHGFIVGPYSDFQSAFTSMDTK